MEDLSHLLPSVQATARLPAEERLRHIRAERWIGYGRAQAGLARLEALLAGPSKQRAPNLLILGPTHNGKSMLVEKFRRRHAGTGLSATEAETLPVLVVQMPSEPSVSRFYALLLLALGAPLRPRVRLADVEPLALGLLRTVGVRMLVIDELHNVLAGKADTRREFLNLIRFLGNSLAVPIVGVGTRDAYLAIRADPQLENRFESFVLPLWEDGEELLALLASFAAALPPRCRCGAGRRSRRRTWPGISWRVARARSASWRRC
ncbi:TniB family NTP-binding protein [Methylomagnum sp.]